MDNIESRVVNIIVDKLGVKRREVTRDASLYNDLSADSLDATELILEFETEFGISIPDDDALGIDTVGDIINYISGRLSSGSSDEVPPEVVKFKEKLNEYLENEDDIVENIDSAKKFLRECENLLKGESDFIQASYRFLQALCCLEYYSGSEDKSLLSKGEDCIRRSLKLQDDLEYKVVNLIYQRTKIDADDPQAYKKHKCISDEFYLPEEENYWLNNYELKRRYESSSWYTIGSAACAYEDKGDFRNAELCAQLILSFESSIYYLIWAYNFLCDLYIRKDGLKPESKGFEYALTGADLDVLGDDEFDEDNTFHRYWRSCIRKVGSCYLYGTGVDEDDSKAFEYTQRAAEYNDEVAMFNLAVCYEDGIGTRQDKQKALKWYKASSEAGLELAQERYNILLAEMGGSSATSDNSSSSFASESNKPSHSEEELIDW